jgi:hypothetical protein
MKRLLIWFCLRIISIAGGLWFGLGRLFCKPATPKKLEQVLIIKPWAIGEVVMATPIIDALRAHNPDCQTHWLVGMSRNRVLHPFTGYAPYTGCVL